MNKLVYNYHTHTSRCGHANGLDEEYVLSAIKSGIKYLGFSDHIILPEGYVQPGIRGNPELLEDYLTSLSKLKEKYKDKVDILIGFEAEYYPQMINYYKELLNGRIDYLILGQHCYLKDDEFTWYFHKDSPIEDIRKYVDDVIEGLKTGLFTYLAHPDLFMHSQYEWNEELEKESRRLLKTCAELNIPVELNVCGMRRPHYDAIHYSYPNIHFYQLIKEYNLKVVLGIDAHNPKHFNQEEIEYAYSFAMLCGFEIDFSYRIYR